MNSHYDVHTSRRQKRHDSLPLTLKPQNELLLRRNCRFERLTVRLWGLQNRSLRGKSFPLHIEIFKVSSRLIALEAFVPSGWRAKTESISCRG